MAGKGKDEVLTLSRLWAGNRPAPAPHPHVVVATMQTLLNRFEDAGLDWLRRPAVIVVDEAHRGITPSYTALLDWLDQRQERSIRSSASPRHLTASWMQRNRGGLPALRRSSHPCR